MSSRLRKLTGIISPRLAGASVCEACGNEFTCGASLRGCWCSEITLTDEARAELKEELSWLPLSRLSRNLERNINSMILMRTGVLRS